MSGLISALASLGPWNWLILAVVLFSLETIVPGVHFLWFGVAAAVVGGLTFATGITWPWQLVVFALVAIATVFGVRRLAGSDAASSDEPALNDRGRQYIDRVLIVEEAIVGGRGKVRVGDTLWQASGDDTAKGERVRVVGSDGTVLKVVREPG